MAGRSKAEPKLAGPGVPALEPVADQTDKGADEGAGERAAAAADSALDAAAKPTPNPMTNMILADLVLRGGGALLRRAVEQNLLGRTGGKGKAEKIIKGRTMGQTLLGTAAVRIATRSVPGAILVGGGLLAKALYDRKKGKKG